MIVGIDRSFKPRWVYRILQLCKPNVCFMDIENEVLDVVEYKGNRSKVNVVKVFKRYYLYLEKKEGKLWTTDNYLHKLSLKYSLDTLKPILLFVLLNNCEMAQFLHNKLNTFFIDKEEIDPLLIRKYAIEVLGDRSNVKKAVSYYLTILSEFDILNKVNSRVYTWQNKKLVLPNYVLMEILKTYAYIENNYEIDVDALYDNIAFSIFDLSNLEAVLMEYNNEEWQYQKRIANKKVVIYKSNILGD